MLEVQLEYFKKTPLLTNTQPDYSRVGNSELLDRTVRSNNWIRSDTIFIENEQIEALSNRPPWAAVMIEQGLPGQPPDKVASHEGVSPSDDIIVHVMDVGANYWSLWNFHEISARNLASYYQAFPTWFDRINRRIGYRGEELDARTDHFSFGAVLYEMATGRQAFSGNTAAVIHDAILNRAPAPALELNPDLPPHLEAIITRAI